MKKTVSLKLNGDVMLSDFTKAMNHFTSLLDELSSDLGEKVEIEWEISNLESGSATAVVEGKSQDEFTVDKIVQAYELIGNAISENRPIPYSESIAKEARAITSVINGKVTSLEMRTEEFATVIEREITDQEEEKEKGFSFGTLTGSVETLSKRGRMRFVLYDTIFDKAVNCYLSGDQEKLMLDAWDKRIAVAGKIYRDPETGRPYEVRDISYIENKEASPPGSFIQAEGLIPWVEGDENPEDVIRRYRDA